MSPVRLAPAAVGAVVLLSCTADGIGGPGIEVSPVFSHTAAESPIVITEFMSDPSKVADASGEWFEVYNGGTVAVDLIGWRIVSGVVASENHTIATNVVVPAQGYIVIGNNANFATNGGVNVAYSYGGVIALNNSNTDWLELRRPDGTVADAISYVNRTISPLPTFSHTAGASRAVVNINVDNAIVRDNTNWVLTPTGTVYGLGDRGTPGTGPGGTITGHDVVVGPVVTVTVTPLLASLVSGRTRPFAAQGFDSENRASPTTFTWTSSNDNIATINASGVATAVGEGSATITATAENGVSGSATLNVTLTGEAATITLSTQQGLLLLEGYTKPVFYTIRDSDNAVVSPSPLLVWSSPNEAIATVSQTGYVTGGSPGTVGIRATAPNGVFGTINFTVIDTFETSAATYRDHLEFGTPADGNPADEIVKTKRQFAFSWNAARGGPNWVSWNINETHFGSAARCDCFTSDVTLGESNPVHDSDYRGMGDGLNRGHMVQSESRTRSLTENAATFLMTNILPQAADNNQGPWLQFENYLNDRARIDHKEIYVIAGGIYGPNPATLKNAGRVQVPDYTWKVAVIMPAAGQSESIDDFGDFEIIAVNMPNDTLPGRPTFAVRSAPWQNYITTVDAIEAQTGFDVLANLADVFEIPAEAGDRAPIAALTAPATAFEGEEITLDARGSSDPDGDALTYTYQISDGTVIVGGPSVTHTFANDAATPYTATVTVRDPLGAFQSKNVAITVRNAAPVATLTSSAVTVVSGDAIDVTAGFTDAGLDDSWSWTLDAGNGASALTGSSSALPGVATGSFTYTTAGSYTVTFTVVDDGGLADTKSVTVTVVPRVVTVIANPGTINPKSQGTLKLTVRGDAAFDASLVDLSTACIGTVCVGERGNSGETFANVHDADGDGDLDLVLHFERRALVRTGVLNASTTSLPFTATLTDGRQFAGEAAVRTTTMELESAQ